VAALPASFKLVTHNGAGYDQLHIPALTARRIVACHVPTAVDDATADTALFLLLGALRNFNPSILALRKGKFRGTPAPTLGHDPQGKVLGVLGMGGIGKNLARKCRALGMQVVYHNRHRLSETEEEGAQYVGFEELLGQADVVSVHVPLNPATRHLLDAKALGMTKRGCTIVNTARGAVIDEAALVEKLAEGHVRSVGLDVYEEEPQVHKGLIENPNVLLLPHMGTWTVETQQRMEEWCIGNISGFLEGREAISVVPEQREMWETMVRERRVAKVVSTVWRNQELTFRNT